MRPIDTRLSVSGSAAAAANRSQIAGSGVALARGAA